MPDPDRGWRSTDASRAFTAFLDLDEVLRRALTYATDSASSDQSRIVLHDAEAGEFVVAAASGPSVSDHRRPRT
jgi:hypothetical protein